VLMMMEQQFDMCEKQLHIKMHDVFLIEILDLVEETVFLFNCQLLPSSPSNNNATHCLALLVLSIKLIKLMSAERKDD